MTLLKRWSMAWCDKTYLPDETAHMEQLTCIAEMLTCVPEAYTGCAPCVGKVQIHSE